MTHLHGAETAGMFFASRISCWSANRSVETSFVGGREGKQALMRVDPHGTVISLHQHENGEGGRTIKRLKGGISGELQVRCQSETVFRCNRRVHLQRDYKASLEMKEGPSPVSKFRACFICGAPDHFCAACPQRIQNVWKISTDPYLLLRESTCECRCAVTLSSRLSWKKDGERARRHWMFRNHDGTALVRPD